MNGARGAGARAAVGAALWLAFLVLERPGPFEPGWIPALLLLAPLALVPLGVGLAEDSGSAGRPTGREGGPARLLHLAARLQLPAAALLAMAYLLRQGPVAAVLALPWLAVAAWTVAGAGALVAWLHIRLALRPAHPPLARVLWTVAALSLVAGMLLAALYGSRFHLPQVRPLDIAWMQALHGTANALGFALAGFLGWWLASTVPSRSAAPARKFPAARQSGP